MGRPVVTLRAPRKAGRNWLLSADLNFGRHGDQVAIHARVSPQTLSWARQNLKKGVNKFADAAYRWLGNYVALEGDWGALQALAQSVASSFASEPLLFEADEEMAAAVELHRLASSRPEAAQLTARALESDEPRMKAIHLAEQILSSPNPCESSTKLWALASSGDVGARMVLQAMCLLDASSCACQREPIEVFYDIEDAISGNSGAVRRMRNYANHYARFRALPVTQPVESFSRALAHHARRIPPGIIPNPFVGDFRRGVDYDDQTNFIHAAGGRNLRG